jgi:hypothetical protein
MPRQLHYLARVDGRTRERLGTYEDFFRETSYVDELLSSGGRKNILYGRAVIGDPLIASERIELVKEIKRRKLLWHPRVMDEVFWGDDLSSPRTYSMLEWGIVPFILLPVTWWARRINVWLYERRYG